MSNAFDPATWLTLSGETMASSSMRLASISHSAECWPATWIWQEANENEKTLTACPRQQRRA